MNIVPYEPLREQWGEYALGDGIHLRARFTMTLVERDGADANAFGHIRINTVLEVRTPRSMHGEPTADISNLKERQIVKEFKDWKTEKEALSIYLLEDGSLVRLRYRPRSIRQTDAFNQNREPIFLVDSDTELTSDPSFEEIRKQQTQAKVSRPKKQAK